MTWGHIWQKFPKLLRFMALFPSLRESEEKIVRTASQNICLRFVFAVETLCAAQCWLLLLLALFAVDPFCC